MMTTRGILATAIAEVPPEVYGGLQVLAQNASGHFTSITLHQESSDLPEPATLALLPVALGMLGAPRRWRRDRSLPVA